MTFEEVLDQAIAMLQLRGRRTYGTLKLHFQLDDASLEVLKDELIYGQRLAVDDDGRVLVWTGGALVQVALEHFPENRPTVEQAIDLRLDLRKTLNPRASRRREYLPPQRGPSKDGPGARTRPRPLPSWRTSSERSRCLRLPWDMPILRSGVSPRVSP
jgi:hypothetical protein